MVGFELARFILNILPILYLDLPILYLDENDDFILEFFKVFWWERKMNRNFEKSEAVFGSPVCNSTAFYSIVAWNPRKGNRTVAEHV